MSRDQAVILVDDLDGGHATETVAFGLDSIELQIDLNAEHAAQLREALAPFIAAARRSGARPSRNRAAPVPRSASPAATRQGGRKVRTRAASAAAEPARVPDPTGQASRNPAGGPRAAATARATTPVPLGDPPSDAPAARPRIDVTGLFREAGAG